MSDAIPADLKFTRDHEWLNAEGDVVTVGITAHAQEALGDLVYVELPEVGVSLEKGDSMAVVESVKAASEVYAPITGEVVEINEALGDAPETINDDPYGEGWIVRIKLSSEAELDELLNAGDYAALLSDEG